MNIKTRKKAGEVIGWCLKCQDHRKMKEAEKTVLKNGRNAVKGKCPKCGTGMFKFVK